MTEKQELQHLFKIRGGAWFRDAIYKPAWDRFESIRGPAYEQLEAAKKQYDAIYKPAYEQLAKEVEAIKAEKEAEFMNTKKLKTVNCLYPWPCYECPNEYYLLCQALKAIPPKQLAVWQAAVELAESVGYEEELNDYGELSDVAVFNDRLLKTYKEAKEALKAGREAE